MNSRKMEYIQLLLEQGRYKAASEEARTMLSEDPDNPVAHGLLSVSLGGLDQYRGALAEAERAVAADPESSWYYYLKASAELGLGKPKAAAQSIDQALLIDPDDADYYYIKARIGMENRNWKEALEMADRGLQLSPEAHSCNIIKAEALLKLNRRAEADGLIRNVLREDPESISGILTKGWICLEEGNHRKALEFFSEAARISPESEGAKAGIVMALKNRNLIYAVMFYYNLAMSKLSGRAQWLIIIGLYFVNRLLRQLAKTNPELAPFIAPIMFLYVVFVFLSWAADPIFNLTLRLHPLGKYALSEQDKMASNLVMGAFILAAATGFAVLATGNSDLILPALGYLFLIIPLSGLFHAAAGWRRGLMAVLTGFLAVVNSVSVASVIMGLKMGLALFGFIALGVFVLSIMGNALKGGQRQS